MCKQPRWHRRDEQLHGAHFAGDGVEDVDGVAGEIDEHLLPTDVGLTHARPRTLLPGLKGLLHVSCWPRPCEPLASASNGNVRIPPGRAGVTGSSSRWSWDAPVLGEVENPSILKKGRSHPNTLLAAPPAATTIAKRFSRVLGMFSNLEVKVLYPT